MADKDGQRPSLFDLDALREAFRKSLCEHSVKDAEWSEHAALFIQQVANRKGDETTTDLGAGDL